MTLSSTNSECRYFEDSSPASGQLAPILRGGALAAIASDPNRQALSVPMPFVAPITIFERIRITGSRNETSTAFVNYELKVGDSVELHCHQDNIVDRWAVEVLYKNERLGWVCADANEVVFRLLEGGKTLKATISDSEYLAMGLVYLMDISLED